MSTGIYLRVSSKQQETDAQMADMKAWAAAHDPENCVWFEEKASGKTFHRPEWCKLWTEVVRGTMKQIVVWRLDRLGRSAGDMISLMDELDRRGVSLWSVREGFDPTTIGGRLVRNVLASFAQYETEVRRERQQAGIQARKEKVASGELAHYGTGLTQRGRPRKLKPDLVRMVKILSDQHVPRRQIAKRLGISHQSVYNALEMVPKLPLQPEKMTVVDDVSHN